jgi:TRAP-type mannitol/chloroaromatic compound transport system permease large subunit
MLIAILFVSLFAMLILGFPVAVALAGSSAIYILLQGTVPDVVIVHRIINGVDSFPLLAIPFFVLAGNLMNTAGITNRIFDFAMALVGWLRGGLGHVNVTA